MVCLDTGKALLLQPLDRTMIGTTMGHYRMTQQPGKYRSKTTRGSYRWLDPRGFGAGQSISFILGAVALFPASAGGPVHGQTHSQDSQPPDLYSVAADLEVPDLMTGQPGPGRRVRGTLAPYTSTNVFHTLYLPRDWTPDRK